jgi:hypothetical protein
MPPLGAAIAAKAAAPSRSKEKRDLPDFLGFGARTRLGFATLGRVFEVWCFINNFYFEFNNDRHFFEASQWRFFIERLY